MISYYFGKLFGRLSNKFERIAYRCNKIENWFYTREMNKITWFFMSNKLKLKYTMDILYRNKQRLHLNGFILDFNSMTIEKEEKDER